MVKPRPFATGADGAGGDGTTSVIRRALPVHPAHSRVHKDCPGLGGALPVQDVTWTIRIASSALAKLVRESERLIARPSRATLRY